MTLPRETKPVVWLVDDRPENREKFRERHQPEFEVRLFSEPDEVLAALRKGERPDALVCDIYFFRDPHQREEIERIVADSAQKLAQDVQRFRPSDSEEGIVLIESVSDRFQGKVPFPVLAFTSKGPYLLQTQSFDRIEASGATWLFKNKYSAQAERRRIRSEINSFSERNNWRRRAWNIAWKTGLITAVVGAILGVVFDRIARHLGW